VAIPLHPFLRMAAADKPEIAYFSMEIQLQPEIPTYSGGLGILAGDMLRSAADLQVPMLAVSLVHRKGYFHQKLDTNGQQSETVDEWSPEKLLEPVDAVISVEIEGREVRVRAWKYSIQGVDGHQIPVLLLDTQVAGNSAWDATLTDVLYGGDEHYRLCQEIVLGIGGCRMLAAFGCEGIRVFHLNEGHSALLALALLERQLTSSRRPPTEEDVNVVRKQCVFTTHTPVPAGFDRFSIDLVRQVLGEERTSLLETTRGFHDGVLNMTYLALRFSHYINGVGMHHGEVSRGMFPEYPIRAITNGVHAASWASLPFQQLYDRHIPEWRRDNLYLRYVAGISAVEVGEAHREAKRSLLAQLRERAGANLDPKVLTIGFARRAAHYKRLELLFSHTERLRWIAQQIGPIQIVYGGKAHPRDEEGKEAIRSVFQAAEALRDSVPVVYVENYDVAWARLLTSGVDLWLNTPHRPFEASGTSGMKAALNGVPSLSILDGWWMEGCIEGVTGWAIGREELPPEDDGDEIASLYNKLEWAIAPMYYGRPQAYLEVMRSAIALNGSFFNTHRMIAQYVGNAYRAE
jgi:starch phosphorylase